MSYPNPYQSSGPASYGQYAAPPVDPMKINAPAIGLIAVGAVDLLQSIYALGRNLLGNAAIAEHRSGETQPLDADK